MRHLVGIALAAWLASSAHAGTLSGGPGKVCDVRDYGAKGDGVTIDTVSIQSAVDACAATPGGGTVRLGDNGTFLSGPIALKSHVHFTIEGRSELAAAPSPTGGLAMVSATDVEDIAITGSGRINAAGSSTSRPEAAEPPVAIALSEVQHARIEGVSIHSAKEVTIAESRDIHVKNVHIDSALTNNLGGLHLLGVQGATFENVTTAVGSSGMQFGVSPSSAGGHASNTDVTVTHCIFQHGTGLRIASMQGLHADHLRFIGTSQGIDVSSTSGASNDLHFSDVAMLGVAQTINIRADVAHPVASVTINNVTGVGNRSAGTIAGAPGAPITGVALSHVSMEAETGLSIENVQGAFDAMNVRVAHGQGLLLSESAAVEQK